MADMNNITPEIIEEIEETQETKKTKKEKKARKPRLIKNQALLRRGGFSLALTAAVLSGIIVINILIGALADRFVLEFDMTAEKHNSISEENIEYLKTLDKEVEIIVCAKEDEYVSGLEYYQSQYGVSTDASNYYNQTIQLLNKYNAYNKKINVRFIDTQTTEFTEVTSEFSSSTINYGDIIVKSSASGVARHRILSFEDIYNISEDSTSDYSYMSTYLISSNNVENAVSRAISYVTSDRIKKALILGGHSKTDYTADYQDILEQNNYDIEVNTDVVISSIDKEFDLIVIAAPTSDFNEAELNAISAFLTNDGELGKGMLFFADATAPYLTNLYDFLAEWGIEVEEGFLYETDESNHAPGDPATFISYPSNNDSVVTKGMTACITGYNIPLNALFESEGDKVVTYLMSTGETLVVAPQGAAEDWKPADTDNRKGYATAIEAKMVAYDSDAMEMASYVIAFSSVSFISSEYNEQPNVSNKELTLAAAERAVNVENSDLVFISKTITEESFADQVTEASTKRMMFIFMVLLPILTIIAGIYIFIRRRNA